MFYIGLQYHSYVSIVARRLSEDHWSGNGDYWLREFNICNLTHNAATVAPCLLSTNGNKTVAVECLEKES